MVSPHANWDDTADGYTRDAIGIFVEPSSVSDGAGPSEATVGVPEPDANAYTVSVRTGLGTGYGLNEPLVDFAEPRAAWEYANLATHYLENVLHVEFGVVDLQGKDPRLDSWKPTGIVSDLDAEEAMRKMLGPNATRLDDALRNAGADERE